MFGSAAAEFSSSRISRPSRLNPSGLAAKETRIKASGASVCMTDAISDRYWFVPRVSNRKCLAPVTIYSLDVLLFLFGTSLLFHVQF